MQPRIADLALSLQPIAEMCGIDAAMTLVRVFPGIVLRVPRTWREDLGLNEAGSDLAQDLCRIFGGEQLPIPRSLLSMEARRRQVHELDARLWTAAQIAREMGFTERGVRGILRRGPNTRSRRRGPAPDARQIGLFDA